MSDLKLEVNMEGGLEWRIVAEKRVEKLNALGF